MNRASFVGIVQWVNIAFRVKGYVNALDPPSPIHHLHRVCRTQISQPKYCVLCERYLTDHDIVRGVKLDGSWVLLSDEDIAAIYPDTETVLTVHSTVSPPNIPASLIDKTYYLIPSDDEDHSTYALFGAALREESSVAVVTYTTYKRTHLGLLSAHFGAMPRLSLCSLHYAENLRAWDPGVKPLPLPNPQELLLARRLIRSLRQPFVHEAYHNEEQQRLRDVLQKRILQPMHETVVPTGGVLNLTERLKTSILNLRNLRKKEAGKVEKPVRRRISR